MPKCKANALDGIFKTSKAIRDDFEKRKEPGWQGKMQTWVKGRKALEKILKPSTEITDYPTSAIGEWISWQEEELPRIFDTIPLKLFFAHQYELLHYLSHNPITERLQLLSDSVRPSQRGRDSLVNSGAEASSIHLVNTRSELTGVLLLVGAACEELRTIEIDDDSNTSANELHEETWLKLLVELLDKLVDAETQDGDVVGTIAELLWTIAADQKLDKGRINLRDEAILGFSKLGDLFYWSQTTNASLYLARTITAIIPGKDDPNGRLNALNQVLQAHTDDWTLSTCQGLRQLFQTAPRDNRSSPKTYLNILNCAYAASFGNRPRGFRVLCFSVNGQDKLASKTSRRRLEQGAIVLYVDKHGLILKAFSDDGNEEDVSFPFHSIHSFTNTKDEDFTFKVGHPERSLLCTFRAEIAGDLLPEVNRRLQTSRRSRQQGFTPNLETPALLGPRLEEEVGPAPQDVTTDSAESSHAANLEEWQQNTRSSRHLEEVQFSPDTSRTGNNSRTKPSGLSGEDALECPEPPKATGRASSFTSARVSSGENIGDQVQESSHQVAKMKDAPTGQTQTREKVLRSERGNGSDADRGENRQRGQPDEDSPSVLPQASQQLSKPLANATTQSRTCYGKSKGRRSSPLKHRVQNEHPSTGFHADQALFLSAVDETAEPEKVESLKKPSVGRQTLAGSERSGRHRMTRSSLKKSPAKTDLQEAQALQGDKKPSSTHKKETDGAEPLHPADRRSGERAVVALVEATGRSELIESRSPGMSQARPIGTGARAGTDFQPASDLEDDGKIGFARGQLGDHVLSDGTAAVVDTVAVPRKNAEEADLLFGPLQGSGSLDSIHPEPIRRVDLLPQPQPVAASNILSPPPLRHKAPEQSQSRKRERAARGESRHINLKQAPVHHRRTGRKRSNSPRASENTPKRARNVDDTAGSAGSAVFASEEPAAVHQFWRDIESAVKQSLARWMAIPDKHSGAARDELGNIASDLVHALYKEGNFTMRPIWDAS